MPNYIDKIYTLDQITTTTHVYSDDPRLELNLYLPPAVKENFPVVIWLPAGGGTKDDSQPVGWARDEFACRGYAGITANVKTTDGEQFDHTEQMEAVSNTLAVVRWVRAHKEELNLSGKKILLGGNSAGALSAVQTAISAVSIKEVYGGSYDAFFGEIPYNRANLEERIAVFGSATISGAANNYFDDLIIDLSDPNYAYHGEEDKTIPYAGAKKTYECYLAKGVPSTLLGFPGAGHKIGHKEEIVADLIPKFALLVTK